ncbi:MAG: OadG-related small transporter subunit [Christensenellales bacterium]
MTDLPIFVKGLIVTGLGLVGVFLVLALFFIAIKLLQKTQRKA